MKLGRAAPRALAACLLLIVAQAAAGGQPKRSGAHDILVMLRAPPGHARPNAVYDGGYGDQASRNARRRQAQEIAERHGLELVQDGWPIPLLALDCFVMRARDGRSSEAAAADVAHEPLVAWSQSVHAFQARNQP